MQQLRSHGKDFSEILYWGILLQICRNNSILVKIGQKTQTLILVHSYSLRDE